MRAVRDLYVRMWVYVCMCTASVLWANSLCSVSATGLASHPLRGSNACKLPQRCAPPSSLHCVRSEDKRRADDSDEERPKSKKRRH